nr:hypothetical protein [Entomoplasma sp. MP1]
MGIFAILALLYGLIILISGESGVGIGLMIFMLIPLAWMLPMTLRAHKAYKEAGTDEEKNHMALAICTLLFVNLISGIYL